MGKCAGTIDYHDKNHVSPPLFVSGKNEMSRKNAKRDDPSVPHLRGGGTNAGVKSGTDVFIRLEIARPSCYLDCLKTQDVSKRSQVSKSTIFVDNFNISTLRSYLVSAKNPFA